MLLVLYPAAIARDWTGASKRSLKTGCAWGTLALTLTLTPKTPPKSALEGGTSDYRLRSRGGRQSRHRWRSLVPSQSKPTPATTAITCWWCCTLF